MLFIYNTLSQQKEPLQPLEAGHIKLYVCGMTVYDYCHIGHARVMVVFDTVVRYLKSLDYKVTYVRNITDIDDKIIKRALENLEDFQALTQRFTLAMQEDAKALHVLSPSREPCATEYMPQIIQLIERLVKNKLAYVASNGDVYYEVAGFKAYGKLSHKKLDELKHGVRVDVAEAKKDPLDFVLWKAAKPNEPSWDSPWGKGRPGWHIECSAMSMSCLGESFDIHGGGADLEFPHHENEIAQSEGATGKPFVNTWMHVGFVQVDKEKMSKSLGNFFTIREVLTKFHPEILRYFIIASHYRSPLVYTEQNLQSAQAALERLYIALRDLPVLEAAAQQQALAVAAESIKNFQQVMNDDFNTPEALAVMFELTREINRIKSEQVTKAAQLGYVLKELGNLLGILYEQPEDFLQGKAGLDTAEIETLMQQRNAARANKNWAEADRLRDLLLTKGIVLEDNKAGTAWRREL